MKNCPLCGAENKNRARECFKCHGPLLLVVSEEMMAELMAGLGVLVAFVLLL